MDGPRLFLGVAQDYFAFLREPYKKKTLGPDPLTTTGLRRDAPHRGGGATG